MTSFQVRPATQADCPQVVEVVSAVFHEFGFTWEPDQYHADLYDLEAAYFSKGWPFWVAESGGRIIGTTGLEIFDLIPGRVGTTTPWEGTTRVCGTSCGLKRLYLLSDLRGVGIGRALLDVTATWARSKGHQAMEIWSDVQFQQAHQLYQRLGARQVGRRICPGDPDESPEYGLFLPLT